MTKGEKLGLLRQVGARLVIARDIAGLTQQELASRAGITRAHVANLEAGNSDTPITTLVRIARALGVKTGRLVP